MKDQRQFKDRSESQINIAPSSCSELTTTLWSSKRNTLGLQAPDRGHKELNQFYIAPCELIEDDKSAK